MFLCQLVVLLIVGVVVIVAFVGKALFGGISLGAQALTAHNAAPASRCQSCGVTIQQGATICPPCWTRAAAEAEAQRMEQLEQKLREKLWNELKERVAAAASRAAPPPPPRTPPPPRPSPPPPPAKREPHEVLGVARGSTQAEIKAAYRALVTKYHPDKVAHLAEEYQEMARKRTLELNEAFEVLCRRRTSP